MSEFEFLFYSGMFHLDNQNCISQVNSHDVLSFRFKSGSVVFKSSLLGYSSIFNLLLWVLTCFLCTVYCTSFNVGAHYGSIPDHHQKMYF